MATGDINGVLASLVVEATGGYYFDIIHVAGNVYAIVYEGPGSDGWLATVSISADGLTLSNVASFEFDAVTGLWPHIIHISGSIYAIVYEGPDYDGWLKTVSISDDGLTISSVASFEWQPSYGQTSDIIHISGSIYAIVYKGPYTDGLGWDGWLKTVSISDDGLTITNRNAIEFDTKHGGEPRIIHIAGNIYAIVYYGGPSSAGWLATVSISADGLTLSNVASFEYDADGWYSDIVHVSGNIYAITYTDSLDDGWLKTVSISDDGLTISNVASFEFDAADGEFSRIIHAIDDIYIIVYSGPSYAGTFKTVSISDDGLTISSVASFEFDTGVYYALGIIRIADDVYAIAYYGDWTAGWLATVGIVTPGPTGIIIRHRFTGGMVHRAMR